VVRKPLRNMADSGSSGCWWRRGAWACVRICGAFRWPCVNGIPGSI